MAVKPESSNPRKTSTSKGAAVFLDTLVEQGVDTIFGYPGGVILPIYKLLPEYPIKHILTRHEQGATHMAEGYARATGKPGVVLVTSGPGATNTITGIADAYYDSTPLVVFTGNVASHMLGYDAFQEADIVGMTRSCTKHNLIVRDASQLKSAIKEAFHVANTGRPGPVLVDLPKDILIADIEQAMDADSNESQNLGFELPGYSNEKNYTEADLDQVLELLKTAKQPVLLSGGGVVSGDAHEEVQAFARRFNLPVACTLMGLGSFPIKDELCLGFCGMHGHYWTNIAIANADVLIVVGSRLNDRQTGKADRFARRAKIVHIDLDPTSLLKHVDALYPIQGEVKSVFQKLLARPFDKANYQESLSTRSDWFEQIETWKHRREKEVFPEGFLSPEHVIDRLFHWMPEDGIVTTEVGQHQMWAAQSYNLSRPRSFLTSGGLGTMGFGFPAAIGAQVAFPERTVLDIAGDGSFQMTLQELAVAKNYKLPVKVAIINNGYLGMIRQWQGKYFGGESEAVMTSPDYMKLAEAYGAAGFVVNSPDDVDQVIQEAYAITDRPVIIDFRVHSKTDVYPWVPAGGNNDEMLLRDETKNTQELGSENLKQKDIRQKNIRQGETK